MARPRTWNDRQAVGEGEGVGGVHLRQREEEEDGDADDVQHLHHGDEGEVEEARHEDGLEDADAEGAAQRQDLGHEEGGEERPHPPDLLALHVFLERAAVVTLRRAGPVPDHLPVLVAVQVTVLVAVGQEPDFLRRYLKRL